ncbi:MAG: hypothetical protein QOE19_3860 [Actinomycetota bacterium]|nr:hypothetical protein [Actinomycetota bacterium]
MNRRVVSPSTRRRLRVRSSLLSSGWADIPLVAGSPWPGLSFSPEVNEGREARGLLRLLEQCRLRVALGWSALSATESPMWGEAWACS